MGRPFRFQNLGFSVLGDAIQALQKLRQDLKFKVRLDCRSLMSKTQTNDKRFYLFSEASSSPGSAWGNAPQGSDSPNHGPNV